MPNPRSKRPSLQSEVAVLIERVDTMLVRMEEDRAAHHSLAERVDRLEKRHAYYSGAAAIAGAGLGWLGNLLLNLVTR